MYRSEPMSFPTDQRAFDHASVDADSKIPVPYHNHSRPANRGIISPFCATRWWEAPEWGKACDSRHHPLEGFDGRRGQGARGGTQRTECAGDVKCSFAGAYALGPCCSRSDVANAAHARALRLAMCSR